jgi:hypothetical protein
MTLKVDGDGHMMMIKCLVIGKEERKNKTL